MPLEIEDYALTVIREASLRIVFNRFDNTIESTFSNIVIEIMENILAPYQVVTHIRSWQNGNSGLQDSFPYQYHAFLKAHEQTKHSIYDGNENFFSFTQGIDRALLCLMLDVVWKPIWSTSCDVYAYVQYPFPQQKFLEFKTVLPTFPYALHMTYKEPDDNLQIVPDFKQEKLIISTIQRVCSKYGKVLDFQEIGEMDGRSCL